MYIYVNLAFQESFLTPQNDSDLETIRGIKKHNKKLLAQKTYELRPFWSIELKTKNRLKISMNGSNSGTSILSVAERLLSNEEVQAEYNSQNDYKHVSLVIIRILADLNINISISYGWGIEKAELFERKLMHQLFIHQKKFLTNGQLMISDATPTLEKFIREEIQTQRKEAIEKQHARSQQSFENKINHLEHIIGTQIDGMKSRDKSILQLQNELRFLRKHVVPVALTPYETKQVITVQSLFRKRKAIAYTTKLKLEACNEARSGEPVIGAKRR